VSVQAAWRDSNFSEVGHSIVYDVGRVTASTPWSEKTITQLQLQLDEALDADITEPS